MMGAIFLLSNRYQSSPFDKLMRVLKLIAAHLQHSFRQSSRENSSELVGLLNLPVAPKASALTGGSPNPCANEEHKARI